MERATPVKEISFMETVSIEKLRFVFQQTDQSIFKYRISPIFLFITGIHFTHLGHVSCFTMNTIAKRRHTIPTTM